MGIKRNVEISNPFRFAASVVSLVLDCFPNFRAMIPMTKVFAFVFAYGLKTVRAF